MDHISTADLIGYASALILVFTIVSEIVRQSRASSSKDVSPYVFVGELLAAMGFTIHSILARDTWFTLICAGMSIAALMGLSVTLAHRALEAMDGRTLGMQARPMRGYSVVVRTGETIGTSADVLRLFRSLQRTKG